MISITPNQYCFLGSMHCLPGSPKLDNYLEVKKKFKMFSMHQTF